MGNPPAFITQGVKHGAGKRKTGGVLVVLHNDKTRAWTMHQSAPSATTQASPPYRRRFSPPAISCRPSLSRFPFAYSYVNGLVASKPLVVFSKSYCPYCAKAKTALKAVGAKYEVSPTSEKHTVLLTSTG